MGIEEEDQKHVWMTDADEVNILILSDFISYLGWFTAYLSNVFLTKLQDPISLCKSRDRRYPNHATES